MGRPKDFQITFKYFQIPQPVTFLNFSEGLQRQAEGLFGMVDQEFSLNLESRLKDGQVSNVQVEVSFLRRVRLGLESLNVIQAKPRKLLQIYPGHQKMIISAAIPIFGFHTSFQRYHES